MKAMNAHAMREKPRALIRGAPSLPTVSSAFLRRYALRRLLVLATPRGS